MFQLADPDEIKKLEAKMEKFDTGDNPVFSYTMDVKPGGISYGEMSFKNFDAREILVEGKPTGEIHIKPKVKTTIQAAVALFQNVLHGFKVGGIDIVGFAEPIEYPIYAKPDTAMGDLLTGETSTVLMAVDEYITEMNEKGY